MEQLLATKLYIPTTRPELVARPRLIEQLNAGLYRKLTLVSAPAGFGKTTLVSEWVEKLGLGDGEVSQGDISIGWLSLDQGDRDRVQFLAYLVAAVNQAVVAESSFGKGVESMLRSQQSPPNETILNLLINEIDAFSSKLVLIFDDYHLVENQSIHQVLAYLIEHLPSNVHLVIITREDPPLPLARLRARDQLTDLRARDLRFTSSEAFEFFSRVMGLDLSLEEVRRLESRTEGWIAGLQLVAISLQGKQDRAQLVKTFSGNQRHVLDYLIEEVLNQQPDDVQSFLLKTAVLDRLAGSLCNSLTSQDNGQEMLELLERTNLFIVPLDGEQIWYRYHHLFADLLRQRLHRFHPDLVPVLHNLASEWFTKQGLHREAIKHSLAGGDYQGAAELISTIGLEIIDLGQPTIVVGWIDALPEAIVKDRPYLCVLHARAMQLTGQLEPAESRLVDAEQALDELEHQDGAELETILGLINSCRAYMTFMHGEHDKTITFARQALEQLPESADLMRVQAALYLGIAYRYKGDFQSALQAYDQISPLVQKINGVSITVLYYLHLGDLYTELAQLHRAKGIYQQALDFTERHFDRPDMPFSGYVYVSIGRILRQWNQLEEAHRLTAQGLALCRDWNVTDILALSCIEMAYGYQAMGDEAQARESIREAGQLMEDFSPWGVKLVAAHQACLNLTSGDLDAGASWAQANDLVTSGEFEFHREIEYLALARVLIAQGQFADARPLIEKIYRIAVEIGKRSTELEGLILLALLSSAQGDIDLALVHLGNALALGEPEGFIRIFVDKGPPMAELLYEAFSRGISPDYVSRLLAAFPLAEQEETQLSIKQAPRSTLIEPLSEREIEVLSLIAVGLTNSEIADRLVLSTHTVKAHTRNIYSKLDAHNRAMAVSRGRLLGILSTE